MSRPGRCCVTARAVALAIALGGAATAAQGVERVLGSWFVTEQADRFGDGGSYVAITAARSGGVGFSVRCIRKAWSLAIIDMSPDPKPLTPASLFHVKLRVDRDPIIDSDGKAINDRVIQLETTPAMVREIVQGSELAARLEGRTTISIDFVFDISGAKRALAQSMKECPTLD
jgi:hypothetical protein